jgi:hypothetical protein
MRQLAQRRRKDGRLASREHAKSTSSQMNEKKLAAGNADLTGGSSRVVLVIVLLALAFIAIIAYFVAQMPRNP